ncbi:MAG: patatin-like phospholipase family protein [Bacteroidetes bacterium]|nr:MAG: patatin-like phospholipase family protein [Bacteroidota bacterium]
MLHFRSNVLLLLIWVLLALFVSGVLGGRFGIPFLFLSPEYLGKVGFWSFFILGFAFGAMVMTWNLTVYLLKAHLFPFLATLSRPFTKFCLNNIFLPAAFVLLFLYAQIGFQRYDDCLPLGQVLTNSSGFLLGIFSLVFIIAAYFQLTNKDILSYTGQNYAPPKKLRSVPARRRLRDIAKIKRRKTPFPVHTYLTESFKPRLIRSVAHYDYELLVRVFKQNHTNALIVQLTSLFILMALGYMIDHPAFRIPAGASIFLLSSIVMSFTGAISYWFQKWRFFVLFILMLVINFLTKYDLFHHENRAYGLNYAVSPAPYTYEGLEGLCRPELVAADIAQTTQILNKWRSKNQTANGKKPKIVFYCVSGGGLKSATWAMKVLQYADSTSHGAFMKHIALMSGASGGILGTAYYRELYGQAQSDTSIHLYDPKYIDDVAADLLNSIAFSIVSTDLFMPWVKFEKGGYQYVKDRGYIFEKQFNENTGFRLDKTLRDYRKIEQEAIVPLMFITPSIVNDGRRMIISSQGVTYMMAAPVGLRIPRSVGIDAVDFGRLLENQNAQNLEFTSALRMNATYPYILPNVYLPTDPQIEVMDAGFRDNFGIKSATRFIHVFKDWIKENTSGVVLVIVRAYDRQKAIQSSSKEGLFESLLNPLGIAGKILSLQDFEHDTNLGYLYDLLGEENFEIIRFTYRPGKESKGKGAPISFHLTPREKRDICNAVFEPQNQQNFQKLQLLLSDN